MKTLYVSDLDGTLLQSNQKTSEFTNAVINELVKNGMLFSYATARSYHTSYKVTNGMTAAFPVIVYNGAFILDHATGNMLLQNYFEKEAVSTLLRELLQSGIAPIVYAMIDGVEKFSYQPRKINAATMDFVLSRKGDFRDRPVADETDLFSGELFYITCIDAPEKLKAFYDKYKNTFHCVYQKEVYSQTQWLEIMPKAASKANAVMQLAKLLECERIVAFGDGMNDIDLFEIADEAYAVENAVPELKRHATAVIDSNDNDGVAKWLRQHIFGNI